MANSRLQQLLTLYFRDLINPDQFRELQELISRDGGNAELDDFLRDAYSDPQWAEVGDYDKEQMYQELISKIARNKEAPAPVVSLTPSKRRWPVYRQVAAAAVIIMLLGTGVYFFLQNTGTKKQLVATTTSTVHDIKAPTTNRATITLANGQKIFLDSAGNGTLATQNNINIVKTADGKIAYEASLNPSKGGEPELLNTLTNPRGSKVIDMMLSDGSRVWLNAGSSVTYPVAFTGKERKVSITGEAYFEVKHNSQMPFMVAANGVEVHDLGTSFNINAYDDEDATLVTLLEGSVRLTLNAQSKMLKPGDQGIVQHLAGVSPSALSIVHNADLDQVMAWKNGFFSFDNTNLQSVMRQVSRWYDVEVVYEGKVPDDQFMGGVARQQNVSALLKVLEGTGTVHFKIEGRKIIVTK